MYQQNFMSFSVFMWLCTKFLIRCFWYKTEFSFRFSLSYNISFDAWLIVLIRSWLYCMYCNRFNIVFGVFRSQWKSLWKFQKLIPSGSCIFYHEEHDRYRWRTLKTLQFYTLKTKILVQYTGTKMVENTLFSHIDKILKIYPRLDMSTSHFCCFRFPELDLNISVDIYLFRRKVTKSTILI